jgi:nickel-dependent lactate racemase
MAERETIRLPYGDGELEAILPESWLASTFAPRPVPPCTDLAGEVSLALAKPLSGPPLAEIAHAGDRMVILLDDHTRATPGARLLPLVLEHLLARGVREEDITLFITHGTHRMSTEAELLEKLGESVCRRFKVVQHDSRDESSQVFLGITGRGTPVWLNAAVVEADKRIGIGHVGPSPYAGYSGGLKLLIPGAAALDTINANHSLVPLGFDLPVSAELPCRADIDEGASLLGLDFVLDVVLNQEEQVAGVFAGGAQAAFRAGLDLARRVYEVPCPRDLDVVIATGFPYDLDLYQAVRAVELSAKAVRQGGAILLVAACPQGIGGETFERLMEDPSNNPESFLRAVTRRDGEVTFGVLGYNLARIRSNARLGIVCAGIDRMKLEAMGFRAFGSLQRAVDALLSAYGPGARVGVFPSGSSTIPLVQRLPVDSFAHAEGGG